MKKEKIQEFTVRITQSNRTELVVVIYEIILDYIKEALDFFEQGQIEEFQSELKHARSFLKELMEALDFTYPIATELLQIYLFVNRTLLQAISRKKADDLPGMLSIMGKLHQAFLTISKDDNSEKLMQNTQKVYAGLTYGKGNLTESIGFQDSDRGYKA